MLVPVCVSACTFEYTLSVVSAMTLIPEMLETHPYRAAASSELSCSATTPGPCVPAESARAHPARFRISSSLTPRFVDPTSGVPDHTADRPMNAALTRPAL